MNRPNRNDHLADLINDQTPSGTNSDGQTIIIMKSHGNKQISGQHECGQIGNSAATTTTTTDDDDNHKQPVEHNQGEFKGNKSAGYVDVAVSEQSWLQQTIGQLKQRFCSPQMAAKANRITGETGEFGQKKRPATITEHLNEALQFKVNQLAASQSMLAGRGGGGSGSSSGKPARLLWPNLLAQNGLVLYTCAANNLLEASNLLLAARANSRHVGADLAHFGDVREQLDKLTSVRPVFKSILVQTNGKF